MFYFSFGIFGVQELAPASPATWRTPDKVDWRIKKDVQL
jgi:hypothetical protein